MPHQRDGHRTRIAQTFQIISSGLDGLYGVGGQYLPSIASESLPFDPTNTRPTSAPRATRPMRIRERDNLTNFNNGKLQ